MERSFSIEHFNYCSGHAWKYIKDYVRLRNKYCKQLHSKPITINGTKKWLKKNIGHILGIVGIIGKKEVFHIGNQDYTYDQSRCKCSSYGAR